MTALHRVFARDCERFARRDLGATGFTPTAWSSSALAKVRARWQIQRFVEHRSTSVFLDLTKQLMEAGASVEATGVSARMAHDEYRHARLAADVLEGLGCTKLAPLDRVLPVVARHPDVSREVAALRNVILCTCISETNAVANFVLELEEIRDPFVARATRALLADEVLHGEYGFRYLDDWAPYLASTPGERDQVTRYLPFAFAFAERELLGPPDSRRATAEERALGLLDRATRRDVFFDVMNHAVVPGLEAHGLGAEHAFRQRSL